MNVEMTPSAGANAVRFVGDSFRIELRTDQPAAQAFVRTNVGRAGALHAEIVQEYREELARWKLPAIAGAETTRPRGLAWRDILMTRTAEGWRLDLAITEPGFFQAKAYAIDNQGRQSWPAGANAGISAHPNEYRSGNTIYCAFTRMFGETRHAASTISEIDPHLARLDKLGYAVIPASGKLRDLARELPHIFETLGCRILHLLPVTPTPTTYARFGRFGSPYATQDLTAIDPALVEFDRRTTGIDQFCELAAGVHQRQGRLVLDIVLNHTGWGSTLLEQHPEWFLRHENGVFASPGAWGTTWEDLVELDHRMPLSWEYLAEVLLTWCRRGVDGFRCDAGYMVPSAAWRYIIAKVRQEFPNALFLLEGLGGAWSATEELLTRGGMQWAYSELFQNFDPLQVSGYLDHSNLQCERVGTLVHYSETHDNPRLAEKGRAWSLLRNRLCALTSHQGAFGFTCGVEWLAPERVNVHSSRGLAWNNPDNLLPELGRLNAILREHPCFLDGTVVRRLSGADSQVLALERRSAEGKDALLVLANLDLAESHSLLLPKRAYEELGQPAWDLLTESQCLPKTHADEVRFSMGPGECRCLATGPKAAGLGGEEYRLRRAQFAWACEQLGQVLEPEQFGGLPWRDVAEFVEADPAGFLGAIEYLEPEIGCELIFERLRHLAREGRYAAVVRWGAADRRRITPVPTGHWVLVEHPHPFRATFTAGGVQRHRESVPFGLCHAVSFGFGELAQNGHEQTASLRLEGYGGEEREITGEFLLLAEKPCVAGRLSCPMHPKRGVLDAPLALLTNGIGGMARVCVDLGQVKSKYDCVLGANLHPTVPVDRHIFVKRVRVWANANRFISSLDAANLQAFSPGPPARWEFAAICGDGRTTRIELTMDLLEGRNSVAMRFRVLDQAAESVRLTVRFDLEDRNFHTETRHAGGADYHFSANCHPMPGQPGFVFRPAEERQLRVRASAGTWQPAKEWSTNLAHPVEGSRGQTAQGDAFSPGWFDLPLSPDRPETILLSADANDPPAEIVESFEIDRWARNAASVQPAGFSEEDAFGRQLALASRAFVVRRDQYKTVIAGYPWFLDWGRDSLICARGLLAGGWTDEVQHLLVTFGRFERDGTLPNTIHGQDTSNRETSDAPLWYGLVCEEFAGLVGPELYKLPVDDRGKTVGDVLRNIGENYWRGTPNGIHADPESALVWSPKHYTWMDTNHPAGTPRQGYPIDIEALWIRLLRQLAQAGLDGGVDWAAAADRAQASLDRLYWLEEQGWFADNLIATSGQPAAQATPDDALRSNCLFPIAFGQVAAHRAQRCVSAAARHLVVPGALRSLAPLPVRQPLEIHGPDWRLLNNPLEPYWGHYAGDEDTRRKPAYHNGTAWVWTLPTFCEALARAWNDSPSALRAAREYLGSTAWLLDHSCLGHLPEIIDGDAPHQARGCDAQGWSVTEALRVWKLLNS